MCDQLTPLTSGLQDSKHEDNNGPLAGIQAPTVHTSPLPTAPNASFGIH